MRRIPVGACGVILAVCVGLAGCSGTEKSPDTSSQEQTATGTSGGILEPADKARGAASDANKLIEQQEKATEDLQNPE